MTRRLISATRRYEIRYQAFKSSDARRSADEVDGFEFEIKCVVEN